MITTLVLILIGLMMFKLAGGLGTLFAIGVKILGILLIVSAVCTAIGAL